MAERRVWSEVSGQFKVPTFLSLLLCESNHATIVSNVTMYWCFVQTIIAVVFRRQHNVCSLVR